MDQRNVNVIIDEATPVTKKQWEYIGKMINKDIVNDFRQYAKDPARWVDRYQNQCRFHEETTQERYNGKQKRK